jgi:2-methylcitrate dehydratase PrpD
MGLTDSLVKNIVKTRYEDLPEEAREATKRSILDTLGVMLPPTTLEPECIAIAEMVKETGGKGESTLIGFGDKAPSWLAAWANGSLTHVLDYDDTTDEPAQHPTSNALPAALAIAEKMGGVSGKDFITAIALATDLSVRMASGPKGRIFDDYPWFPITTFGTFSAAAAPAKIMGFSEDKMSDALGMALYRVFGISKAIADPHSMMRAIRDGFTNKEGVLAALVVDRGVTACTEAVEKLYAALYGNDYDPEVVIRDLGKRFRGAEASLKPWPACRETHGGIQAAMEIINKDGLDTEKIEKVVVTVGEFSGMHLLEPLETKRTPKLSIDAKFSFPFVMAIILAKKKIGISDFLPEGLSDPKVLAMAQKIEGKVDHEFGVVSPVAVDIKTSDGKTFYKKAEVIYGSPQNPLSRDDVIAKFKDCASYARKPLPADKLDKLIEIILELEKVKDMREITELLG